MENLRFYFELSDLRPGPIGIMRRYEEGTITRSEVYNFKQDQWVHTEFFAKYQLGHNDNDYVEVSREEAEEAIEIVKQRRAAQR